MKVTESDKHSSLLWYRNNYGRKKVLKHKTLTCKRFASDKHYSLLLNNFHILLVYYMDNYTLAYYGKVTNTTVKPLIAQAQVNKKTLLVIKRKVLCPRSFKNFIALVSR